MSKIEAFSNTPAGKLLMGFLAFAITTSVSTFIAMRIALSDLKSKDIYQDERLDRLESEMQAVSSNMFTAQDGENQKELFLSHLKTVQVQLDALIQQR